MPATRESEPSRSQNNIIHFSETTSSCLRQLHNSQYLFTTTSIARPQSAISLLQQSATTTVNMFASAVVALLALFASAVSAQTNASYIDPNSVSPTLKGK